ncbi:MAG TPA: protein-methionine-sulfoxide reductase catalytic subunit MsrP [Thiomicrospira sp.]|jgi:sulfoxide reductase catalytic subunit YedY|nr:protein-methionine-sulfoxide reductase catalytic subunit MsrP [Thiomicrospira sp.]
MQKLIENEVTDESLYLNRRAFIQKLTTLGLMASPLTSYAFNTQINPNFQADLKLTNEHDATHYNNFYELGTAKSDPSKFADSLKTKNWQVEVTGLCHKPMTFDMDKLEKLFPNQERIYRFRCVEGWSMVVPWSGFPLADLLKFVEPSSKAKYVKFTSINDPTNLKGQRIKTINWPYVEGLRLDEAMNPLTLMATGMYGKSMPNQNGAPIRLIVPWKYGFKSAKSIVKIELVEQQPTSSWTDISPKEYGFYSNVNPNVPHRRWSQAKERPLGSFFKKKTLMFNGYQKEVAHLYKGMDLKEFF